MAELSYSAQFDILLPQPDLIPWDRKKAVPKPSLLAQEVEAEAYRLTASTTFATQKRNWFSNRIWGVKDMGTALLFIGMHLACLAAPFTFSWQCVIFWYVTYCITGCFGIAMSFHRQLSHHSFTTSKWLEYFFAYCGVMTFEGKPTFWVSSHRFHHLQTDTPLDPHSPAEGFWWSHMGWVMDKLSKDHRAGCVVENNVDDMRSQRFYQHMEDWYWAHVWGSFLLLYVIGGWPALIWGGPLRVVSVWHGTFSVNSASHIWGSQPYKTGDLSRNLWWVAVVSFGEWHNNHHAFGFSARHGLEWWEFDVSWYIIRLLQKVGLAWDVHTPTPKQVEYQSVKAKSR
ncbi:FAD5-like desaturase [Klebsormidium nitens]|uniref:FAD5-like desaturase n=1 Tax=Klebsormidium nitens TaxID=105231 RepID=A0A1Y1IW98_KLENI|nr:FAD5-like desaturase [Klebsormidium nitens]|eukprot:GAQ93176.1 FAD5-like desaturase [Klebsormidium nitens]